MQRLRFNQELRLTFVMAGPSALSPGGRGPHITGTLDCSASSLLLQRNYGLLPLGLKEDLSYGQFTSWFPWPVGFPGVSDYKESASNAGNLSLICGSGRFPWRREWQPTPVFLPGESHGQRSLGGYTPWGGKESDTTDFTFTFHPVAAFRTWWCFIKDH